MPTQPTDRKFQRDRLHELLPSLATEDGLLPTRELLVRNDGTLWLRADGRVQLHPHWRAAGPTQLLLRDPQLWENAAIRVQVEQPMVGGAPVWGVPFHKAIAIVLREREHRSSFCIPNQNTGELYSTLLTRLRHQSGRDGPELVLEVWQWLGGGIEVHYSHAIMSGDATKVVHLDCALVSFSSEEDASALFYSGVKKKGTSYEKYFRLDTELPLNSAVSLMRVYFPVDELLDEYFVHEPRWPHEHQGR